MLVPRKRHLHVSNAPLQSCFINFSLNYPRDRPFLRAMSVRHDVSSDKRPEALRVVHLPLYATARTALRTHRFFLLLHPLPPGQLGRNSARTHSVHTSPLIWWTIQAAVLLEPCAAIFSQHVAPHPEVGTGADPGTDPLVLAGGAAPPAAAFFCFLAADAWHVCSDCTERESGIEAHDTGNRESPYGPWPPYPQCRCHSTFLSGSELLIKFARK